MAEDSPAVGSLKAKKGRKKGAKKWTDERVHHLLDCIQVKKPCGPIGWDQTLQLYHSVSNDTSREEPAIRKKYNDLLQVPKPTGDPMICPLVKRAKQIYYEINSAVSSSTLGNIEEEAGVSSDDGEEIQEAQTRSDGDGDAADVAVATAVQPQAEPPRTPVAKVKSTVELLGSLTETASKRRKIDQSLGDMAEGMKDRGQQRSDFMQYMLLAEERRERARQEENERREAREREDRDERRRHDERMMTMLMSLLQGRNRVQE